MLFISVGLISFHTSRVYYVNKQTTPKIGITVHARYEVQLTQVLRYVLETSA